MNPILSHNETDSDSPETASRTGINRSDVRLITCCFPKNACFSKKKLTPDRGRIVTTDGDQVKYLPRHLGVGEEELLRAVDQAGNSTAAVRKELGKEK